ncbi:MAG: rhomboid family intramembrane serine protease [Bdellovibrionaceae bacterium]|nr:rhomboid family intramembrane serine protease [Pseudobdellovibrionaceae bacterium]
MKRSILVILLIAINILVYFLWASKDPFRMAYMQENFAVSWEGLMAGRYWTLLTSVFSHYMFIHLLFNMLVLNSFGPIVIEVVGSKFFIIFYLVAGIFSSLCHAVVTAFFLHQPNLPAVGASGAIAGVLLLFCLLFPREKILLMGIIPLPAMWGAIAFVALDVWGLIAQSRGGGLPIGHGAHLGGALCGLIAYFFLRKRVRRQF